VVVEGPAPGSHVWEGAVGTWPESSHTASGCGRMTGNSDVIGLGKSCRQSTRNSEKARSCSPMSVCAVITNREFGENIDKHKTTSPYLYCVTTGPSALPSRLCHDLFRPQLVRRYRSEGHDPEATKEADMEPHTKKAQLAFGQCAKVKGISRSTSLS